MHSSVTRKLNCRQIIVKSSAWVGKSLVTTKHTKIKSIYFINHSVQYLFICLYYCLLVCLSEKQISFCGIGYVSLKVKLQIFKLTFKFQKHEKWEPITACKCQTRGQ